MCEGLYNIAGVQCAKAKTEQIVSGSAMNSGENNINKRHKTMTDPLSFADNKFSAN